jgi:hypothetical protein
LSLQELHSYTDRLRDFYDNLQLECFTTKQDLVAARQAGIELGAQRDEISKELRLYKVDNIGVQILNTETFNLLQENSANLVKVIAVENIRRAALSESNVQEHKCVITHSCPVCYGENGIPDTCGQCGHLLCGTCAEELKTRELLCPICRGYMTNIIKINGLAYE